MSHPGATGVMAEAPFTTLTSCSLRADGRGLFLPEEPRFFENRVDITRLCMYPTGNQSDAPSPLFAAREKQEGADENARGYRE